MSRIQILAAICSLLQVLGLVLVVAGLGDSARVLVGIGGFAAIVNAFLPLEIKEAWARNTIRVGGVCGFFLIVFACFAA